MTTNGSEIPAAGPTLLPALQLTEAQQRQAFAGFGAVLTRLAERYTGSQSCAIPEEQAEQLLRSITYTVRAVGEIERLPLERLLKNDLQQVWERGVNLLHEKQKSVLVDLKLLLEDAPTDTNIFYTDALKNLAEHLTRYDPVYSAHRTPSAADGYALLCPVPPSLRGLFYTAEYIRRLQRENDFTGCFDPSLRNRLYKALYPDTQQTMFSLCEPCLLNALALTLSHRDVRALSVPTELIPDLTAQLAGRSDEELSLLLENAAERACAQRGLTDADDIDYFRRAAASLAPRVGAAAQGGHLAGVFAEIPA